MLNPATTDPKEFIMFEDFDWSYDAPDIDVSQAINTSGISDWSQYMPIGAFSTADPLSIFGDYASNYFNDWSPDTSGVSD